MVIEASFNGKICEIPGIYVDNFTNPLEKGAKAYFLSHFHTDHTVGLDDLQLFKKLEEEKCIYIYTSKMTAAIIAFKFSYLKDYVKVLGHGSNLITIQGDAETNQPETIVNVKLIPAGHCLGSTMFLFETTSVKVLFTGDFRIRPNDLPKYAALHDKNGQVLKLDTLYVDTTFMTHENLPKRSDSVEEAIELIRTFLEINVDQFIILDTSANFGYEYVFNQIYKSLGFKVYVEDEKWAFYRSLQHLIPGVTNDPNGTKVFLKKIPTTINVCVPPKKIRFAALYCHNWNDDQSSIHENGGFLRVCFPTHCSRSELISFVEYLNPVKVVGFPNRYEVKVSSVEVSDEFVLSPKKTPNKSPSPSNAPQRKLKRIDEGVLRKILG